MICMNERETTPEGADQLGYHGGNINLACSRFPHAPRPWIDLSTGINPVAYSVGEIPPSAWTRLPEPAQLCALEAAARSAYHAGPLADVVAAPGTQALIQWLPHIVPARRVGILRFTYGEHETCWRAAGAEVVTVGTLAELAAFDVGVVVNPNNPDGHLLAPDLLAETARSMAQRGGRLIVDEAFMDVCAPHDSLIPRLPDAPAIVLRSFGKIYGLAGVRLGFAVAPRDIAALLRRAIGPWAVSGPAIAIGRRALSDGVWLSETLARLAQQAERLDRLLEAVGFEMAGGTPLFRLTVRADAASWFARLGQAGILTRPFLGRPDWLRFGIPDAPDNWVRLEAALGFAGRP
jgi:cobalamin biosynthesis protein CobC